MRNHEAIGAAAVKRTERDIGITISRHPRHAAPRLDLRVLGHCVVEVDGEPLDVARWPRKASVLLRILAVVRHRRLSRDEAIELLWPDSSPPAGTSSLKNLIHRVRKQVESEGWDSLIVLERGWVILNPVYEWSIDADQLLRLSEQPGATLSSLERAAHLLRGEPLLEDQYEDWANPVRQRLLDAWRGVCRRLVEMERDRGLHKRELAWAERLVTVDPMDEEAVQLRLRALVSLGRRGAAIQAFHSFEERLLADLNVAPAEETRRLIATPTNVPMADAPIIGRASEMQALEGLIDNRAVRLVTLVGPGGVGKTRLALEAARCVLAGFPDGIFFVSLSDLASADLVLNEVATVLGMDDEHPQSLDQRVLDYIGGKRILMVLDNFEHLLGASISLAHLLDCCPALMVVATSRTPLRLAGEFIFDVSPLRLPLEDVASDTLREYAAVELFIQRAMMAGDNREMTCAYLTATAEICRRLDGLPLAIELAAARTRVLSPESLLDHLSARLPLLCGGRVDSPPRQRTLKATIDWSYNLLDVNEQKLFRRLSVLVGGFTLESAGALWHDAAGRDDTVLELLASLLDKSVLHRFGTDETRFVMLETIAEYARDRLRESGELPLVQEAHARFYLAKAEAWETQYDGSNIAWLEQYDREMANIRAALAWCLTCEKTEIGLRLAAAAAPYWYRRVRWDEGQQWLESLLLVDDSAAPLARARALRTLGLVATFTGNLERAETASYAAIDLFSAIAQPDGIAWSLHNLAMVASERGDFDSAVRINCEIRDRFRGLGIESGAGIALLNLAEAARLAGDYPRAIEWATECIASFRAIGSWGFLAQGLCSAAASLAACREYDTASTYIRESLDLAHSLRDTQVVIQGLEVRASIAAGRGQGPTAARLWGAAEAMGARVLGRPSHEVDEVKRERRRLTLTGVALDSIAWERAWNEGKLMSYEQAIGEVLSVDSGARLA